MDIIIHIAGEQLQAVSHKLVQSGNSHARKYNACLGTALLSRNQYLGTRLAFRIGKHPVLLHNQRLAQRNHKQHAQHASAQRNQRNLNQGRRALSPLTHPHKQGRQGKDGSCCHRFTGRTNGLHHVVFQNGIPSEDYPDNTHGDNCRRYGCGHGHTDAKAQISIGSTKENSQKDTQDHRNRGYFRNHLVRRYKWFKTIFIFHVSIAPFVLTT